MNETEQIKELMHVANDGLNVFQRRRFISNMLLDTLTHYKVKSNYNLCNYSIEDDDEPYRTVKTKMYFTNKTNYISTVFSQFSCFQDDVIIEVAFMLDEKEQLEVDYDDFKDDDHWAIRKYKSVGEYIDIMLKVIKYYENKKTYC